MVMLLACLPLYLGLLIVGPTGTTAEAAEVMDCTLEEVFELVDAPLCVDPHPHPPAMAMVTVMPIHQAANEA